MDLVLDFADLPSGTAYKLQKPTTDWLPSLIFNDDKWPNSRNRFQNYLSNLTSIHLMTASVIPGTGEASDVETKNMLVQRHYHGILTLLHCTECGIFAIIPDQPSVRLLMQHLRDVILSNKAGEFA